MNQLNHSLCKNQKKNSQILGFQLGLPNVNPTYIIAGLNISSSPAMRWKWSNYQPINIYTYIYIYIYTHIYFTTNPVTQVFKIFVMRHQRIHLAINSARIKNNKKWVWIARFSWHSAFSIWKVDPMTIVHFSANFKIIVDYIFCWVPHDTIHI